MKRWKKYQSHLLFSLLSLIAIQTEAQSADEIKTNLTANNYRDCQFMVAAADQLSLNFTTTLINDIFAHNESAPTNALNQQMALVKDKLFVYLYLYDSNHQPDNMLNINDFLIGNATLNGIAVTTELEETNTPGRYRIALNLPEELATQQDYQVQLSFPLLQLKSLSLAATVGVAVQSASTELQLSSPYLHFIDRYGVASASGQSNQCALFDTTTAAPPAALKIDPKFELVSAFWQLESVDLDDLLAATQRQTGLAATIASVEKNQFCIKYLPYATRNQRYTLTASNKNGLGATNADKFLLKSTMGNSIYYNLQLNSATSGPYASFLLPSENSAFNFHNTSTQKQSSMTQVCWAPHITLFAALAEQSNQYASHTGDYSDELTFFITPAS